MVIRLGVPSYNLLCSQVLPDYSSVSEFIWHKQVSLKVSLFAWRLIQNRLHTKDNLHRCDIIIIDSRACMAGCGSLESIEHLFLDCQFFISIWQLILGWLGLALTASEGIMDHFVHFVIWWKHLNSGAILCTSSGCLALGLYGKNV